MPDPISPTRAKAADWPANTIVLIGDSLTVLCNPLSTPYLLLDRGYFSVANVMLKHRFKVLNTAGVGGERSDEILARVAPDVLAYRPDYVYYQCGTNDIGQLGTVINGEAVSVDTAYTYWTRGLERCRSAGVKVITQTVTPAGTWSSAQATAYYQLNAKIREYCRANPNVILVDAAEAIIDGSLSNAQPASSPALTTTDLVHYSAYGARRIADRIYNALRYRVPEVPLLPVSNSDAANLIPNPMMTGTSGTKSSAEVTGSVANNYTLGSFNNATSVAGGGVVGSKVTRTDTLGGFWQQIAITNTGVSTKAELYRGPNSGYATGDLFVAGCEFEMDSDITELVSINLTCSARNGGTILTESSELYHTPGFADLTDRIASGAFETYPMPVPANTSNLYAFFRFVAKAGTVRVGRFYVRKVI